MDYPVFIKEAIQTRDVLERYGIPVNEKGFACCPFHNEKTPSLKVYNGDRGWYCFGCGEHGDVISFVMRFFSIDFKSAIAKLNDDFSLGLNIGQRITKRQQTALSKRAYETKRQREKQQSERDKIKKDYIEDLNEWIRLDRQKREYAPKRDDDEWHPLFIESLQKMERTSYNLDIAETRFFEYERTH